MALSWKRPVRKFGNRAWQSRCERYRIDEWRFGRSARFTAYALDRSWNKTRFIVVWGALSDHRTLRAAQAECERFARALAKWKLP